MTEWIEASERLVDMVSDIIDQYHHSLKRFNIGVILRSEAQKSGGKVVLGDTFIIPAKYKPLMGVMAFDAGIWLAQDYFIGRLNPAQRIALIDQRLCALEVDDNDRLKIRRYDVQDYLEVLERHGYWNLNLLEAREVLKPHMSQPVLFEIEGTDEIGGSVGAMKPDEAELVEV